jgi:hypothetical protein
MSRDSSARGTLRLRLALLVLSGRRERCASARGRGDDQRAGREQSDSLLQHGLLRIDNTSAPPRHRSLLGRTSSRSSSGSATPRADARPDPSGLDGSGPPVSSERTRPTAARCDAPGRSGSSWIAAGAGHHRRVRSARDEGEAYAMTAAIALLSAPVQMSTPYVQSRRRGRHGLAWGSRAAAPQRGGP